METATRNELLTCRLGTGPDPTRVGLVLDYRGDHPPMALLALLREHGWRTPAPHAPPAAAIDWDRPDPIADRPWSLRPFLVTGALAVPGGETPPEAASPDGVRHLLDRLGVVPEDEPVDVGSLRETRPGLAEVVAPGEVPDATEAVPEAPVPGLTVAPAPAEEVAPVAGQAAPLSWIPPDPSALTRTVWAVVRRGAVGRVAEVLHQRGLDERVLFAVVYGVGRGGGRVTRYRGRAKVEPLQRVQVQVAVDPDDVDELVAALVEAARTGDKGDGKIWVT